MFSLYTLSKLSRPLFEFLIEVEGDGIKFRLPLKIFSTLRIGQLGPWSPLEQQTEEFLQDFTMKGVIHKI